MIFANGDKLEANYIKDSISGKITLTSVDGKVYTGDYKEGKKNGEGIIIIKSNLTGILIYPNNDKYEGEFQNDNITGKGTLTCADGSIYTGDLKEGKKHGKGI